MILFQTLNPTKNKFIAEGEVEITKNNMQLKSDKLVYDLEKIITLTGEITFISDEQFFQASEIKYNLIDKRRLYKRCIWDN